MTLREKQSKFVRLWTEFMTWCIAQGYEMTEAESYRSDEQAEINALGSEGRKKLAEVLVNNDYKELAMKILNNMGSGIRGSLHEVRLAKDMNFFKNGQYLNATDQLSHIGMYWESLDPECAWGGRFNDGNHFSLKHEGKK